MGILNLLGLGGAAGGAVGGAGSGQSSGSEPDWFAQFNPANKSPNGGINPNPGQAQPWEPYVPHGGVTGYGEGGMTPPPADIQPNQPSYADFQRDYWAPDREQVLAGMTPPMATNQTPMPNPNQPPPMTDWTRNPNPGQMPQMDWPMPQKQGGSIWSKLGSLGLGGLASGGKPQGGLVAQALIKMRTPHGTVAHVPPNQIEEALRRGATQIGGQ